MHRPYIFSLSVLLGLWIAVLANGQNPFDRDGAIRKVGRKFDEKVRKIGRDIDRIRLAPISEAEKKSSEAAYYAFKAHVEDRNNKIRVHHLAHDSYHHRVLAAVFGDSLVGQRHFGE